MNKEALEFYLESKGHFSLAAEEKIAEEKVTDGVEKLAFISNKYEEKQANFKAYKSP